MALFHYRGYLPRLSAAAPALLDGLVRYGYLGVQVFFVVSGFVIAKSIRADQPDRRELGKFLARRVVRLAPPYWLTVAIAAINIARWPDHDPARVSAKVIAAHLAFATDILKLPKLLDLFWTLGIEVQHYLVFAAIAGLAGIGVAAGARGRRVIGFVAVTLVSHVVPFWPGGAATGAFFPFYVYAFALGALARMALDERGRGLGAARAAFVAAIGLAIFRSVWFHGPSPIVSAAVAVLAFVCSVHEGSARVLGARPLAVFGRLSYSFYLVHALAGGAVIALVLEGRTPTAAVDAAALGGALVASTAAAWVMWRLVEQRATDWSRRIR